MIVVWKKFFWFILLWFWLQEKIDLPWGFFSCTANRKNWIVFEASFFKLVQKICSKFLSLPIIYPRNPSTNSLHQLLNKEKTASSRNNFLVVFFVPVCSNNHFVLTGIFFYWKKQQTFRIFFISMKFLSCFSFWNNSFWSLGDFQHLNHFFLRNFFIKFTTITLTSQPRMWEYYFVTEN